MRINKKAALLSITIALVITLVVPMVLNWFVTRDARVDMSSDQPAYYSDITPKKLKEELELGEEVYLLDVHIPKQEHISGTDDFIPFNQLAANKSKLPANKDTEIVVYCRSGNMSETASRELVSMGYTNVKNLLGGVQAWKAQGYSL